MGVFAGNTQIARRVADPITDDTLPSPGSLSWSAITTPAALAGTVGQDCMLVHGSVWRQIQGMETEFIGGDHMVTVMKTETYTIVKDQILTISGHRIRTVMGNTTDTTIGSHTGVQVGPDNKLNVGPNTETHCAPKAKTDPTSFFDTISNIFFTYILNIEAALAKVEIFVNYTGFTLSKFEAVVIKSEAVGMENSAEGGNLFLCGLENKLDALATRIQAIQPSIGASKLHIVASTIKTIVLGVNQFI